MDSTPVPYALRPATDSDLDFMYQAHSLGLGPYIIQIRGWEEAKERAYFLNNFMPAECQIILLGEEPVGWLRIEEAPDHIRLDYIVMVPQHQRQGIGTWLVKNLLKRANRRRVPVKLNVLRVNPAKTLYERLGFREVGGDEHRIFMETTSSE